MKKTKQQKNILQVFPRKNNKHYFFGYYGKSPWSFDEKYIVGLEVDFIDRHPGKNYFSRIILVDLEKKEKTELAKTSAWNWQQGCMLQWISLNKNKIIFNDIKAGKHISRIINVETKKEEIIPYAIYDIDKSGRYALSISYEKLNIVRRGYGYEQGNIKEFNKNISEKEGVYLIDLKTKKRKLIISLKELYNYKKVSSMDFGKHWIDQPVFSPDAKRFCFLHRWELEAGLFHTRFFTSDLNGKDLFMFPDSGFYSHFSWKNSKEILMFCSVSEKLAGKRDLSKKSNFLIKTLLPYYRKFIPRFIRKRVLPIGYYLLRDKSKISEKIKIYNEDGHPSFSPNGKYVITDSYPDKKAYRKLILYDWENKKSILLGKFYSIPDKKYLSKEISDFGNSPFRADLHPRWDRKNKKVCFDSIHKGYRNMHVIYLKDFSQ